MLLKAVITGVGGSALRLALQLVLQLSIVRLTDPEQYAVFALAALCVSLTNFLSDAGIATALQHTDDAPTDLINGVFTIQLALGSLGTIGLISMGGMLEMHLKRPGLAEALFFLAPVPLLQATAAVSQRLLLKDLRVLELQAVGIFTYIVGYGCIGLPLAHAGLGFKAICFAWLAQSLLTLVCQYFLVRHPIRIKYEGAIWRNLAKLGLDATGVNVCNWIISSIDRFWVSRVFGASPVVGYYAVGYNMIINPANQILTQAQSIFFSAGARVASIDRAEILCALQTFVYTLVFPLLATVSINAQQLVVTMLGDRWMKAGELIAIISISYGFQIAQGLATPLVWAERKIRYELYPQLLIVLVWILAVTTLTPEEAVTVAKIGLAISIGRAAVVLYFSRMAIGIAGSRMKTIYFGYLFACLTTLTALLAEKYIQAISGMSLPTSILIAYSLFQGAAGLLMWRHMKYAWNTLKQARG